MKQVVLYNRSSFRIDIPSGAEVVSLPPKKRVVVDLHGMPAILQNALRKGTVAMSAVPVEETAVPALIPEPSIEIEVPTKVAELVRNALQLVSEPPLDEEVFEDVEELEPEDSPDEGEEPPPSSNEHDLRRRRKRRRHRSS